VLAIELSLLPLFFRVKRQMWGAGICRIDYPPSLKKLRRAGEDDDEWNLSLLFSKHSLFPLLSPVQLFGPVGFCQFEVWIFVLDTLLSNA